MCISEGMKSAAAVTDGDFHDRILGPAGVVLVDVWASWCTPCLALGPVMDRLAGSHGDRVQIMKLDADKNPDTVARYQVRALPTVLLFRAGVLVGRATGAKSYSFYAALLDGALEPGASAVVPVSRHDTSRQDDESLAEARSLVAVEGVSLIFKHSLTCPYSAAGKRQYDAFRTDHPDVPARVVTVQTERALSDALAELLGLRHESPQAIVLRDGRVFRHASHGAITAAGLGRAVADAG